MREILLIVFTILLVGYVLVYPFKVKTALHFNVFEGVGFLSVKAFCFRLFSGKFMLTDDGKFEMQKKGKPKRKKKKPISLLYVYFTVLAKRLAVKKFEWYFTCGSENDARFVSMLCGYILSIDSMLSAFLLDRYKHIKIFNDIDPIYDKDRLEISASVVITFSLLDMIIGVVIAYYKYIKLLVEKKNA